MIGRHPSNCAKTEILFEFILRNLHLEVVEDLRPHFYLFEEREAIRHFFRMAASFDLMIVGEPQILGQLNGLMRKRVIRGRWAARSMLWSHGHSELPGASGPKSLLGRA
ncbi:MAG: hypothetical protein ACRD19_01845 [Terriglobia bacterium]